MTIYLCISHSYVQTYIPATLATQCTVFRHKHAYKSIYTQQLWLSRHFTLSAMPYSTVSNFAEPFGARMRTFCANICCFRSPVQSPTTTTTTTTTTVPATQHVIVWGRATQLHETERNSSTSLPTLAFLACFYLLLSLLCCFVVCIFFMRHFYSVQYLFGSFYYHFMTLLCRSFALLKCHARSLASSQSLPTIGLAELVSLPPPPLPPPNLAMRM